MLDKLVLRPTRDRVDHGMQQRLVLSSRFGPLETFGLANFPDPNFLQPDFAASDFVATDPPDLLLLKFPGTAGRAERSSSFPADLMRDTRTHVWTWNPPGYGNSAGRPTLRRIAAAAIDFFNASIQRYEQLYDAPLPPVWLCGNSLGCATALHVAAVAPQSSTAIRGLILRNPPPVDLVVKHVARRYPLGKLIHPVADQLAPSMNAIYSASKVTQPAIFLQCQNDSLVPPELQQQVRDAHAGPQTLVPLKSLGHDGVMDEQHLPLVREAVHWLREQSNLSIRPLP
ncbi:alpha/beta hydrolase [Novipirellula galeiformis]|uniref:alpha/beta hydrolase n=1 Tax=Novipirellula galeiformis TaxID=2528004 RepID=UPI0011B7108B|nr:alpha/beta hydrolase [Novipirellula galeiformis]